MRLSGDMTFELDLVYSGDIYVGTITSSHLASCDKEGDDTGHDFNSASIELAESGVVVPIDEKAFNQLVMNDAGFAKLFSDKVDQFCADLVEGHAYDYPERD